MPVVRSSPLTVAALPPVVSVGRGASLPFAEHEAENAITTGSTIGPSRVFSSIAAEASGRRAVRLDRRGQYSELSWREPLTR